MFVPPFPFILLYFISIYLNLFYLNTFYSDSILLLCFVLINFIFDFFSEYSIVVKLEMKMAGSSTLVKSNSYGGPGPVDLDVDTKC